MLSQEMRTMHSENFKAARFQDIQVTTQIVHVCHAVFNTCLAKAGGTRLTLRKPWPAAMAFGLKEKQNQVQSTVEKSQTSTRS